jgi:hypothetical protein
MSNALKKMLIASMAVSGIVALLAIADIAVGFPFAQSVMMDILFVLSAALVIYMGWDALKDMN